MVYIRHRALLQSPHRMRDGSARPPVGLIDDEVLFGHLVIPNRRKDVAQAVSSSDTHARRSTVEFSDPPVAATPPGLPRFYVIECHVHPFVGGREVLDADVGCPRVVEDIFEALRSESGVREGCSGQHLHLPAISDPVIDRASPGVFTPLRRSRNTPPPSPPACHEPALGRWPSGLCRSMRWGTWRHHVHREGRGDRIAGFGRLDVGAECGSRHRISHRKAWFQATVLAPPRRAWPRTEPSAPRSKNLLHQSYRGNACLSAGPRRGDKALTDPYAASGPLAEA